MAGLKHYHARLSENERFIYEAVVRDIDRLAHPIRISGVSPTAVNWQKVFDSVLLDHPEYFYLNGAERCCVAMYGGMCQIAVKYAYPQHEIRRLLRELNARVDAIAQLVLQSEKDRFRRLVFLHNHIARSTAYPATARERTNQRCHNADGALLYKSAVCEGIAKAMKLLCDTIGIECLIVCGTGVDEKGVLQKHAWNIVKLDGSHYHIDVTWDTTLRVDGADCYDYFLATDDSFLLDHAWDRDLAPKCVDANGSFFSRTGNVVRTKRDFLQKIAHARGQGQSSVLLRIEPPRSERELQAALTASSFPLAYRYNDRQGVVRIHIR